LSFLLDIATDPWSEKKMEFGQPPRSGQETIRG